MVYISSEGNVGETRKRGPLSIVRDFVVGIFDFVGLFFRTLTANPAVLESERGRRRTTYTERQGVRRPGGSGGGPNIRGVNRLGCARTAAGG